MKQQIKYLCKQLAMLEKCNIIWRRDAREIKEIIADLSNIRDSMKKFNFVDDDSLDFELDFHITVLRKHVLHSEVRMQLEYMSDTRAVVGL